jgi:hypothetical protein
MPRHSFTLAVSIIFVLTFAFTFDTLPAARAQSQPVLRSEMAEPSPSSVLGFSPGDDRTIADWQQITDYFTRLDRASERVSVQTLGETTRGLPLIVAFISAPENIRDLKKYKDIQRKLADPRLVSDEAERDALLRSGKTVVVVSCSIHSDEIVSSQMSMQLAYELSTAQDADTREILQNTILLLIPSANPDGVQLVANWYRKTLGTPFEGKDPPEIYHHYAGHDNNRDWFMLNLRETRLLTRLFWKEWFPQIVYDVHQQGTADARFTIPPFYDPPNPHIAPLLLREVGLLGHKIASDLQAAGYKGVITNAKYDTWWHGGFRSAPYFHNSIGILSEAASADLMSPVVISREQLARTTARGMPSAIQAATNFPDPWPGGLWRARDIMNMEMLAARSVLSMAAKFRANYLRNFYELGRRAINSQPVADKEPLAYVLPAGQGRDENVARLVETLMAQGLEVHRLDHELHATLGLPIIRSINVAGKVSRVMEIISDRGAQEIPAGSYIVFFAQPYRANVQALFEPQTYPERLTPLGEAERPYDVAGWTLPMQMGVEVPAVMSIRETVEERRLTLIRDAGDVRRDLGLDPARQNASTIKNPLRRNVRLGLYRSWTANIDEGWTRYVFDTFNIPYQTLLDKDIRAGNLRRKYDVIILPSQRSRQIIEGNAFGSYPPEYTGGITPAGLENLRLFVVEGGTLICFDASTELAIKQFNLPLRNVLEGVPSSEFYCPGSILALSVDTSHPTARGLQRNTDAYFINSSAFELKPEAERVRVVARYGVNGTVLRSGWLLGENRINGKIALVEVSMGKGRVVLFGFRPQHRGQTWGTFPFIFNAISPASQSR